MNVKSYSAHKTLFEEKILELVEINNTIHRCWKSMSITMSVLLEVNFFKGI